MAIISAVLLLSGCGPSEWLGKKTGEKIMEKTIESQTGGKVDVDSGKNEMTIKTDEGQVQVSQGGQAKIPENFPKELIAAGDAKVIVSTSTENGSSVAYITDEEQQAMLEKYKSDLIGQGWKKDMELDTGTAKMLNFSKGEQKVTISIGENNSKDQSEKTMVNVILVKETE